MKKTRQIFSEIFEPLTHSHQIIQPNSLLTLKCTSDEEDWQNNTHCLQSHHIGKLNSSLTKMFPLLPLPPPNVDKNESLRQFQAMMTKNTMPKYTPNSISILINFGFYDSHFYYNAEAKKHDCDPRQLWDPFTEVCRTIYCSTYFTFKDLKCLGKIVFKCD